MNKEDPLVVSRRTMAARLTMFADRVKATRATKTAELLGPEFGAELEAIETMLRKRVASLRDQIRGTHYQTFHVQRRGNKNVRSSRGNGSAS
jgi:hypothetical protein